MSGKGGQTVGYHYLFTFIAGIGRGPINELRQINVGDKVAWDGHACGTDPYVINKPKLFGGEDKEGGIQGAFRILFGAQDQVLPAAETVATGGDPIKSVTIPSVKDALGGLVSEFRGFTAIIFDGLVASMNPYLKEWKFRVRRYSAGWHNDVCWYPEKSVIYLDDGNIHAMNPAHIIYQCKTDPDWGQAEDPAAIDENSFIYAANLFCSEGMGLCFVWYRQEDVDDFIQVVCDHVGAIVYQDRTTGKFVLRVLRDDYDPDTIPAFDFDTGLVSIEEDDSASSEEVNEVIVTGHDPKTDKDFQVRAQNVAGWYAQGGPISRPMEFKGIPTAELGLRKAQQELRLLSGGLKKFKLVLDRRAWQLAPGAVIRISSPENNITNMVVRLGEVSEPQAGTGRITIKAVEDVYALPTTTFGSASTPTWTSPNQPPVAAASDRLLELGYRDLYRIIGPSDLAMADDTDSGIGTVAVPGALNSYTYDLASKASGETAYTITRTRPYTASATLVSAIGPLDTSMSLQNLYDFDGDSAGHLVLVDDELIHVTAFVEGTNVATIARGCGDTIPADHAAGARMWDIDDDAGLDSRQYVAGETALAKVLPVTGTDILAEADATERSIVLVGRQALPYPPGDMKVDGVSVYALTGEHAEPVLTWVHRDRVLQEDTIIAHTDASIGPEAGVTYTIRIYGAADALLRTTTGIAGTTWTYTTAMQAADSAPPVVRIELEAVRGALASWQPYSFNVTLTAGAMQTEEGNFLATEAGDSITTEN